MKHPKRWSIIRHIRYFWLDYRVHRWALSCYRHGLSGFPVPNESDIKHLEEIWKGER